MTFATNSSAELGVRSNFAGTSGFALGHKPHCQVSLLCGSATSVAGTSGRFSSSSLPPSFAKGRRTAVLFTGPCAAEMA